MSKGPGPSKVQELTPEYLGALSVAFGDKEMPEACKVYRSWDETSKSLNEILPHQTDPFDKCPLPERKQREFAAHYFREGHSTAEIREILGVAPGAVHGLNLAVQHKVAEALGVTMKEAGKVLLHYRVQETCRRWMPWHTELEKWIGGGPPPQPIEVNFHQNFFEAASLFERLHFPWRYLCRDSQGPVSLSPSRRFQGMGIGENQPFLLEVREGKELHNVYCIADADGTPFVPRISNWRAILGPAEHFSRLLIGDGPVCLQTAFSPRPVRILDPINDPNPVAFLFAEVRCKSGTFLYVPREFEGDEVFPFVAPVALRSGQPVTTFGLHAYHRGKLHPITAPIGEYDVTIEDRMIARVELRQHLGHLATWQKQGARQLDAIKVKQWLTHETDKIPRIEPLMVHEGEIFEGGEATGRTRKFVNFLKNKLHVPKRYEGKQVLPCLVEIDDKRILELHAYPQAESAALNTFKIEKGRLVTCSLLGT